MAKRYFFILIIIFPFFLISKNISLGEVNDVMAKFLEYHIESKELDETIIRRSFKIFVERFDRDKIYLLEDEVEPFLNLNTREARRIIQRIQKDDFSDYIILNDQIQKGILRARNIREMISTALSLNDIQLEDIDGKYSSFAKNDEDLQGRIKNHINRFYLYQKKRSNINSKSKREKVLSMYEKKVRRFENDYLYQDYNDHILSDVQKENLLSLHILKSFAKSLDAHSYYFSEEEAYEMRLALEKEFQGVGLVLSESIDGVIVTDMISNSPAEKSGVIEVNDIIVEIDGHSVEQLAFEDVMQMMKQKNNPHILLGFKRISKANNVIRVKLARESISMDDQRLTYDYEIFGNGIIGKLDLRSFYENSNGMSSEKDLKKAIKNLKNKGLLKGLILDLRENAGGFLSQAVKVAGLFISNGVVVISKNHKNELRYLRSLDAKTYYNGPLIVLTSKLSASASEIVAAALQDYGVALIVGDETTFGKGSIQYQTVTDKEADYFYKVTVGKYYTVSGKTTQINGVKADIVVPSSYLAYKIGERYLEYPLSSDRVRSAYSDPLSDLEVKIKLWFKQNYMPHLQKKVTFWHKMVSQLKDNSEYRIKQDPNFQNFFKKQKILEARLNDQDINIEYNNFGVEDIQMQEAINILKDMIYLEGQSRKAAGF